jgi:hypothetical protein
VREAALCFDNMKNMNNEPMKLLKPGTETKAGIAGQRWVGKRARPGKGGKAVGKRTGFSHLFPDYSTQVVDFPHLTMVRHFLDANFTNERELGKNLELEGAKTTKIGMRVNHGWSTMDTDMTKK